MTGALSRRAFVNASVATGVLAGSVARTSAQEQPAAKTPPSEKIRIGAIGVNGMGRSNLFNCARHTDVEVAGVCDVSEGRRKSVLKRFPEAKEYGDYRKLLEDDSIDAVIIATPPHWHALIAIEACQAGKDIYLQKPMTMHLAESIAVKNAVKRHKRISQIGTQIHAGSNYRRVVEKVRCGQIGTVTVARAFFVLNQGKKGIGKVTDTTVPQGVDWEMWLGPGPMIPFNGLLFANSHNHCSFMDYSGGWTPGMGPHTLDLIAWALNMGYPTKVDCSGGRYFVDDDGNALDVQEMQFSYPGLTVKWWMSSVNSYGFDFGSGSTGRRLGVYFHGDRGTIHSNYSNHEVIPEGNYFDNKVVPKEEDVIAASPGHEREWLDSIKSRKEPSCNVDYHTQIDIPIVLGNLSYRLGRSIQFDPKSMKIVGDAEAARAAVPEYRKPWKFPVEYYTG